MYVKKFIPVAIIIIIFFVALSSAFTKPSEEEISDVFLSAESLFKAMAVKDYPVVWQSLTTKTKQNIIDAIYKAATKRGLIIEKDNIRTDFIEGGEIAKAYWNSYLDAFDPNITIRQSKWTIKTIKKDTAEIDILYKKSPNPAILQLYREDNVWKVGLEETFGARNLIPFK